MKAEKQTHGKKEQSNLDYENLLKTTARKQLVNIGSTNTEAKNTEPTPGTYSGIHITKQSLIHLS